MVAAILAAAATVVFVVWTGFTVGGGRITTDFDDLGEAVAALVAAACCAWAAYRSLDRQRLAWALLAASAASWGLGEVIWSVYEVGLGIPTPFPSAADAGYLAAIPLAIAGILAFPSAPSRLATRGRAVLDGAIVGLSLLFVSWAAGLGQVYASSPASLAAQLIGLAYPVGDIVIATVLILALRRAPQAQRSRMALLLGGLAANAFSDSAFAYLTANGTYANASAVLSSGWVIGYLMIALAALLPSRVSSVGTVEGPTTLWQRAVPWMTVLAAAVTVVFLAASDRTLDQFETALAGGLGILLVLSQVLAHRDSLALVLASRREGLVLAERTALLNQVIAHAPLGIARVGVDMKIIDANPRLGDLLHIQPKDMVGTPVAQYLPADEFARVFETFQPLWQGRVDFVESDSEALRADGTKVWLHWSATAVKNARGRIDYFLAMYEDNSVQHIAQEAASAHLAGLERLSKLKSEFVSVVSHEFRTALTGILGFSELLRGEDLKPDEVKDIARDINTDATRLNRLINDMLDLDRIEAGRMTLQLAPVDLNLAAREAVDRAQASSSKHVFTTSLDPAVPLVQGDYDRLFQVMTNLLNNAIKYSPHGGEVVVASHRSDSHVEVSITDHGLGIPAEFVPRLFERYERLETPGRGKILGTGLGLALCRQIVEMHGGRIWADSTAGQGSVFHFTVPAQAPPPTA